MTKTGKTFVKHKLKWDKDRINKYMNFIHAYHDESRFAANKTSAILLEQINKFLENGNVLDIGFGKGQLLIKLSKKKDFDLYGIETCEDIVEQFLSKNISGIEIKKGDITNIPFKNNKFDYIFFTDVIEHLLEEDLQKGLQEIHSKLKKNGKVIVTAPYKENMNNRMVMCPECGAIFHRVEHQRSFSPESISKLLNVHNFKVIKIGRLDPEINYPVIKKIVFTIYRKILGKDKKLMDTMIVIAKK